MREIKFRAWDEENRHMFSWEEMEENFYMSDLGSTSGCINMQFTGLKDKNSKEVYEGDVILYIDWKSGEKIGVVKWYDGHAGYGINNGQKLLSRGWVEKSEITGNIYED